MKSKLKIIAGIGNPGQEYQHTRHNVGMWFVDQLLKNHHLEWSLEKKLFGCISTLTFDNDKLFIFKPTVYMNESGKALAAIINYYKISPDALLVVHDDLDLDVGIAKLKFSGGHGGHNGLADIINALKTNDFHRLRVGIGHPGAKHLVHDYVLKNPSRADEIKLNETIDDLLLCFADLVSGNFEKIMQKLHTRST